MARRVASRDGPWLWFWHIATCVCSGCMHALYTSDSTAGRLELPNLAVPGPSQTNYRPCTQNGNELVSTLLASPSLIRLAGMACASTTVQGIGARRLLEGLWGIRLYLLVKTRHSKHMAASEKSRRRRRPASCSGFEDPKILLARAAVRVSADIVPTKDRTVSG